MSILDNPEFLSAHSFSAKEYHKAKMRLLENEPVDSLACVRNSLESLLKSLCKNLGMDMVSEEGKKIESFGLIENLKETGVLSKDEAALLHRLRKLSNKAHHPDEEAPPTMEEAREGVERLDSALEILYSKFDKSSMSESENGGTTTSPRYYDPQRRYRAAWCHVYSREKLFENEDFAKLSIRANNGDIDAMLDIAIGFLPKNPVWGTEQLVCMPKYYDKQSGREYYNSEFDAPDSRYYYWILSACQCMVDYDFPVKDSYKQYIPTVLFEGIKCAAHATLGMAEGNYVACVRNGQPLYASPGELVQKMFGTLCIDPVRWAEKLIAMIEEAGTCDIIDPLHHHNRSIAGIRYLTMCGCYNTDQEVPVWRYDNEGNRVDFKERSTIELLKEYLPLSGEGDIYYSWAVNQINQAAAEEEARIQAEEQQKIDAEKQEEARALAKKKTSRRLKLAAVLVVIFALFKLVQWMALEPIDLFASVRVKFLGAAPYGYVEIINNSDLPPLRRVDYVTTSTNGLKNRDEIEVKAKLSDSTKKALKEYGYKVTEKSKTYIVSGLPEAVTDVKDLNGSLEALEKQAVEDFETQAHSNIYYVHERFESHPTSMAWLMSLSSMGEVKPVGEYLLLSKDKTETEPFNKVILIFEAPMTITFDDELEYDGPVYYAAVHLNVTNEYRYEPLDFWEDTFYYSDFDDAYYELVQSQAHQYTITEIK